MLYHHESSLSHSQGACYPDKLNVGVLDIGRVLTVVYSHLTLVAVDNI